MRSEPGTFLVFRSKKRNNEPAPGGPGGDVRLIFPFIIRVSLWAFAGIAIGRHFISRHLAQWKFAGVDLSPGAMLTLFWVSFAIGYFDMLMSVGFNPIRMVNEFMGPRFDVPWGRGKFGDVRALFYEMGAMLYLVPPLAGVILGRRERYTPLAILLVLLALLFTLF